METTAPMWHAKVEPPVLMRSSTIPAFVLMEQMVTDVNVSQPNSATDWRGCCEIRLESNKHQWN